MIDFLLQAWTSSLIELSGALWKLGAGRSWRPGEKLSLLFAGYNGTRNTGSDVRVEEMLRQVRRVLGAQNISLSVLTQNFELTRGYFGDARQLYLPDVFPPMLHSEVPKHDGVIACEGSMFKNKFSLGYGAEAGAMDPSLQALCRRYCRDSTVITRNLESLDVLGKLGVPTD